MYHPSLYTEGGIPELQRRLFGINFKGAKFKIKKVNKSTNNTLNSTFSLKIIDLIEIYNFKLKYDKMTLIKNNYFENM